MTTTEVMEPSIHAASLPGRVAPQRAVRGKRSFWWIWVLVVLVLGGGGVGYWAWRAHTASAADAAAKAADVMSLTRGSVEKTITSSGKVTAAFEVEIKCRAGGEVIQLPFDISQSVKKGDLLCQLDTVDQKLNVRSAQAQVAQAQAKLAQARANLKTAELNLETTRTKADAALVSAKVKAANLRAKAQRQKELVAQNLGSPEERETADTEAAAAQADELTAQAAVEELKQQEIQLEYKRQDVNTAEAQLDTDSINLETQKQQLVYATVTSPMDGVVSALNVQQGQIIASGLNAVNGGTTILTLNDLSRIYVIATVDESDIGGVKVGQKSRITASSFPNRVFTGEVVRIAVKGVNTSNVVTFEVKVEVSDPDKALLKPEMTGDVTVIEDQRNDVLLVPSSAVIHKNGKIFVTLENKQEREITLGVEGTENVEVTSGLKEGERVIANVDDLPTRWKSDDHDAKQK